MQIALKQFNNQIGFRGGIPLLNTLQTSNAQSPQTQPQPSISVKIPLKGLYESYIAQHQVSKIQAPVIANVAPYKNDLKDLFAQNKSVIMAVVPRLMNAKDTDGNGLIQDGEQSGTFINAIERLDEFKKLGVNTLHVLPIHPPGHEEALGTAGSIYAPKDFLETDPRLRDASKPGTADDQFKLFCDECHKRGIRVMLDLPSCGSIDFRKKYPEMMSVEKDGSDKTPQGWCDIRMMDPWTDKDNKILNKDVVDYHKKFLDKYMPLGIDGIRADVARAKPPEFWDVIIPYSRSKDPNFGWLAETYTYEDASPQLNMPYDRPEDNLKAGFDTYYGQYHIAHQWTKAKDIHNYVIDNLNISQNYPKGKSMIGSFTTHDDESGMLQGGVRWVEFTNGLQATLPMLNPYFLDGQQTGDYYLAPYENMVTEKSKTDSHILMVHRGKLDIFNNAKKPGGDFPQIANDMTNLMKVREKYSDIITKGDYIPLYDKNNNQDILSFIRSYNGKTLLIVANRNMNTRTQGTLNIPGLKNSQPLNDLNLPKGEKSMFQISGENLKVDLGEGRFHIFEIDTPQISKSNLKSYRQNL